MRKRYGDIPVLVRRPGKKRWIRAHAVWVSDVFAWRGSPAAWNDNLLQVKEAKLRTAGAEECHKLHRLGEAPVIVNFELRH